MLAYADIACSNTQCDQCFYVYRVERRGLAKFVRVAGVREVGALLMYADVC
jgi:hypothetical protein